MTNQPVGRWRRITGYLLLGLGVLFWADIFFFLIYLERHYGPEDWLRFYVILWFGALLITTSLWLAYRSRAAMWLLLALAFIGISVVLAALPAKSPR